MWALSSLRISHTLWLLEWQSMDIIWTNLFDRKAKKKYTTLADLGEKKFTIVCKPVHQSYFWDLLEKKIGKWLLDRWIIWLGLKAR